MINARTFGGWQKSATGNGVTDDTAALQAALNLAATSAAPNMGGVVYIPAGAYKVTAPLTIPRYVSVRGDGAQTGIYAYHGGSVLQSLSTINLSTAVFTSITDLTILAAPAFLSQGQAIVNVAGTFFYVRDVSLSGFKRGVVLDQTELTEISRCDIESCERGIWLVNGAEFTVGALAGFTNGVTITGRCNLNGCGWGVVDDGGVQHNIGQLNLNACTSGGIYLAGVSTGELSDCSFETVPPAIKFSYLTLTGAAGPGQCISFGIHRNFINGYGGNPVVIVASSSLDISHNIFAGCTVGVTGAANCARIDEFDNFSETVGFKTLDARGTTGHVESWVGQPTAGFTNDYPTAAELNAAIKALGPGFAPQAPSLPGHPQDENNVLPWPHP